MHRTVVNVLGKHTSTTAQVTESVQGRESHNQHEMRSTGNVGRSFSSTPGQSNRVQGPAPVATVVINGENQSRHSDGIASSSSHVHGHVHSTAPYGPTPHHTPHDPQAEYGYYPPHLAHNLSAPYGPYPPHTPYDPPPDYEETPIYISRGTDNVITIRT